MRHLDVSYCTCGVCHFSHDPSFLEVGDGITVWRPTRLHTASGNPQWTETGQLHFLEGRGLAYEDLARRCAGEGAGIGGRREGRERRAVTGQWQQEHMDVPWGFQIPLFGRAVGVH